MSINNSNPTQGIMSYPIVHPQTGQMFMLVHPGQHQLGVPSYSPRGFIDSSGNGLTLPPGTQQRFIAHPAGYQQYQLQPQIQIHPANNQSPQQQAIQQSIHLSHLQQQHSQAQKQQSLAQSQHQQAQLQQQHQQQLQQQQQLLQQSQNKSLKTPVSKAQPQEPQVKRERSPEARYQQKEISNTKAKHIKDNCVGHYIEGQLIIETSQPLSDLKLKSVKKKEKKKQQLQMKQQLQQMQQELLGLQQQPSDQKLSPLLNQHGSIDDLSETKMDLNQIVVDDREQEIRAVRADMPNWSVSDVVKFIEQHEEIRQYSSRFAEDEVDGAALLLMIDRNLNLQNLAAMFKSGPAMKVEAALSKYKLND